MTAKSEKSQKLPLVQQLGGLLIETARDFAPYQLIKLAETAIRSEILYRKILTGRKSFTVESG